MKNNRMLINDNWSFALTEPDSDISVLKDVEWYKVRLPHDWLIGDTANLYKSGCGWYKRSFIFREKDISGSVILSFDGVYMDTTVYVNGKEAFVWKYGYTSFSFDIAEFLTVGKNEVVVRVNHKSPNTRWYSGAGIYRNVYLRLAPKVYIPDNGVYFHAKKSNPPVYKRDTVGAKSDNDTGIWRAVIETELSDEFEGVITHRLINEEGKKLAAIRRKICGKRDKSIMFVNNPLLWDIESPERYYLITTIADVDGNNKDVSETICGFRHVKFSPDEGLLLNGRKVKLQGVCMHHDLGALGAAVNYDATYRQLKLLKEMGVNAVRTSHNPASPEFINICDCLGLLVVSEFLDMWEIPKNEFDYARFFNEWYKKDVKAWVQRDRNHPCVIMWSIGNEIPDTHKGPRGLEVAQMLAQEVELNDSSHNARCTIGSNYMPWENAQKVADYLKLAGYNYAERLYDEHHKNHPDWVIYGSETASTVRSRGIYHFPVDIAMLTHDDLQCSDLGNSVVGWGATPIKAYVEDIKREYSMGQFVWTGFDYIGEPTPYSTKNSYFGILDTAGFPKASYYFYKSVWDKTAEPFIHAVPYWDFNRSQRIDIIAYSNIKELELFYDGKSYGRQHLGIDNGNVPYAKWTVPYNSCAEVDIRGYNPDLSGDEKVCLSYNDGIRDRFKESESTENPELAEALDEPFVSREVLHSFGDAAKLRVKCDRKTLVADGLSMAFIEIEAVDKDGNFCANANNRVKVKVDGPAYLVGLDNGDSTDYDSYKGNNRRLFSGRLLAMVMAGTESGNVTVTVTSAGLSRAKLVIPSVIGEIKKGVGSPADVGIPPITTPYTSEIPIRKIELTRLTPEHLNLSNLTARVKVEVFPQNATYKDDIKFKCVAENGVEVDFAEIGEYDGEVVKVNAKGDGEFKLRAYCNNGGDTPSVTSELEFIITELGEADKNPYSYTAACLVDVCEPKLNLIERGAVQAVAGESVLTFYNVDFGIRGAGGVTIYVGNCGDGRAYNLELYLGRSLADDAKKLIGRYQIDFNGGWDRAYPQYYEFDSIITGKHDVTLVLHDNCIFGGFEFTESNRAFATNKAGECTTLYGDDFTVTEEGRIESIGNNVVVTFTDMDFGNGGARKIAVTARTPLDFCTIQLRCTDKENVQITEILEFPHSEEYTTVEFDIELLRGIYEVSFIFLPGTKIDFESFRFLNYDDE